MILLEFINKLDNRYGQLYSVTLFAEEQLTTLLSAEIAAAIDREIIRQLTATHLFDS